MSNIKSVGLSEKFKAQQVKRILYMRDVAVPPVMWHAIAKRLEMNHKTVKRLYLEAKRGEEKTT